MRPTLTHAIAYCHTPYVSPSSNFKLSPFPFLSFPFHFQNTLSLSPILRTAQSFSLSAENPKRKTPHCFCLTQSHYPQQHSKCAVPGRLPPLFFVILYISLFLLFGAALTDAEEHPLWAVFRPSHWIRKVQTTGA